MNFMIEFNYSSFKLIRCEKITTIRNCRTSIVENVYFGNYVFIIGHEQYSSVIWIILLNIKEIKIIPTTWYYIEKMLCQN